MEYKYALCQEGEVFKVRLVTWDGSQAVDFGEPEITIETSDEAVALERLREITRDCEANPVLRIENQLLVTPLAGHPQQELLTRPLVGWFHCGAQALLVTDIGNGHFLFETETTTTRSDTPAGADFVFDYTQGTWTYHNLIFTR